MWEVLPYNGIPEDHSDKLLVGLCLFKKCVFDASEGAKVSLQECLISKDLSQETAKGIAKALLAIFQEIGEEDVVKSALVEGGTFSSRTVVHFYGDRYYRDRNLLARERA